MSVSKRIQKMYKDYIKTLRPMKNYDKYMWVLDRTPLVYEERLKWEQMIKENKLSKTRKKSLDSLYIVIRKLEQLEEKIDDVRLILDPPPPPVEGASSSSPLKGLDLPLPEKTVKTATAKTATKAKTAKVAKATKEAKKATVTKATKEAKNAKVTKAKKEAKKANVVKKAKIIKATNTAKAAKTAKNVKKVNKATKA